MTLFNRVAGGLSLLMAAVALLVARPAMAEPAAQPTHYSVEPSHKAAHDGTTHQALIQKPKAKAAKPLAPSAAQHSAHPAKKHANAHGPHDGKKAVAGAKRDVNGKLARSSEQKTAFKKSHPCPATGKSTGACPGYVIDHKVALKRGGADRPQNMQWQTKQAAKAKDKVE
jgi:hypothetical protein